MDDAQMVMSNGDSYNEDSKVGRKAIDEGANAMNRPMGQ